jgi:hypothetical protein
MKRFLPLAALAFCAAFLVSCAKPPVHVHHYHSTTKRTTSTSKSASVGGGGNTPEGFQAVTPPSSYSR